MATFYPDRFSTRDTSSSESKRRPLAAWLVSGVVLLVGCDNGEPMTRSAVAPKAPTLAQIEPVADSPRADFQETVQIDLPKRQANPPSEASQPTTLVMLADEVEELSEEDEASPSASDLGPVEWVPTPIPQKEVVAEIVPTPEGVPSTAIARLSKPRMGERDAAEVTPETPKKLDLSLPYEPENSPLANSGRKPSAAMASERTELPKAPTDNLVAEASVAPSIAGMDLREPPNFREWAKPELTLFVTGQQHGYIEPCGCTGLENQKGGVARRMTFLSQLREEGWDLMPIDAGNLIRRYGKQAEIKFHRSLEALREMGYVAVGFGPDDVRLGVGELILEAAEDGNPERSVYASANVVLLDPSLMPTYRVVERNGLKVGITSVLDPASLSGAKNEDIQVSDPVASAKDALSAINSESPDYRVLTYYGEEDSAKQLAVQVPGFDLVVVAGGYGEPTFQPESIEGSETKMILTGNKGMYVGLVGLTRNEPIRYARVPLTHEFEDAPEMRQLMADYQDQLRKLGLDGLGLQPIPHPSGGRFVGTEACGKCHTTAYAIWQGSMHAEATEHLVHPGERGDVSRHFDPECLSCHVTGWNPQNYYPYLTGYLDLEQSAHLHGNGCENCHGPGEEHSLAEGEGSTVDQERRDQLRLAMQLPLDEAKEKCMECHDLDNSPDFHEEGAFEDYWSQVEHYGLD